MRKFWIDNLIATVFTFSVLFGLYEVTQLNIFNAFDPLGNALGDMEITDIAFSQLRDDPPIDTNIVIVNIGFLSRGEVGQQIFNILKYDPKVIALDAILTCDRGIRDPVNCPSAYDTLGNMIFAAAVDAAGPRMVMGEKLWQSKTLLAEVGPEGTKIMDSIEHTDPELLQNAYEGFVNLDTDAEDQEDLKICRVVNPKIDVKGKTELAFSTKIAWLFDSLKANKYLAREKEVEVINYRGNIPDWYNAGNFAGRYTVLDVDQALDTNSFSPSLFKDKIVIMGFLGEDLRDRTWEDKFITPLNKNYAGKTRPDMYGVVVHANIVSMILNEDYINELTEWQQGLLAFVVCLLNVALFSIINKKLPIWFDGITVLVQLIQILVLSFLMIYLFSWIDFKLNLTLTLAAIALCGTCFEIYNNVIKRVLDRVFSGRPLTKVKEEVLTPYN